VNDELIGLALRDQSLSHRALGVLLRVVSEGRVMNAEELSSIGKEGRDAMRAALRELIDAGYILSRRDRVPNTDERWRTIRVSSEARGFSALSGGFPADGFPAPRSGFPAPRSGFSGVNSHIANSDQGLLKSRSTPNGVDLLLCAPSAHEVEKGSEVESFKDLFGSAEIPDGPDVSGLSKLEAIRLKRAAKQPDKWTAGDMASEFGDRVREAVPDPNAHSGQLGAVHLRKILGSKMRANEITPAEGPILIDLFFKDPRNLHRVGFGAPLWKRFLAFIPTVKETSRIRSGVTPDMSAITVDDAETMAQEALRRLSG